MLNKHLTLSLLILSFNLFASDKGVAELTFKGSEITLDKVDILLVVDNSGSMNSHGKVVKPSLDKVLKKLDLSNDWRVGIITSDTEDVANQYYFGLNGNINSKNPQRYKLIENAITSIWDRHGNATENLFDNVLSIIQQESSFIRDGAKLEIIYITDEDDQSRHSTIDFVAELYARTFKTLSFTLVSPKDNSSCPTTEWNKLPKLIELVKMTKGLHFPICNPFGAKLVSKMSSGAKLFLNMNIPATSFAKMFINEKEVKSSLNKERDLLIFIPNKKIQDHTDIKIRFNL